MFNIESEYDKYRREAEFIEIEGYDNSGEEIEENKDGDKRGFKTAVLSLFLFGTIGTIGYFGYDHMQNQGELQKRAVMGVFTTNNHLNREEIEKGLNRLYQKEEQQQKIDETIASVVDDYIASKTPSSNTPKKDISSELNGMVDSFYNQEAIPAKLDSMVDDFYSEQSSSQNSRFVIIKDGDTLAKVAKRFYGNSMKYQKIIDANQKLKESETLYIGQKINIPY